MSPHSCVTGSAGRSTLTETDNLRQGERKKAAASWRMCLGAHCFEHKIMEICAAKKICARK